MSMIVATIFVSGIAAFPGADNPPQAGDSRQQAAEKLAAAADADALVDQALKAEAKGLKSGRDELLRAAVAADPSHTVARGLLGQVSHQGRWESPEKVGEQLRGDPQLSAKLAEYNERREKLSPAHSVEAQRVAELEAGGKTFEARGLQYKINRKLAPGHEEVGIWCEKNGLEAEAVAHFTTAVRLDAGRESSWRHLGYLKYSNQWIAKNQLGAFQREISAQTKADRIWEPQLRRWKGWLAETNHKDTAEAKIAEINDPRAVPMMVKIFGSGDLVDQQKLVQVLKRIANPTTTLHLAILAVRSSFTSIRKDAIASLKDRDQHDYVEALVKMIRLPWTYEVQPVNGPGSQGILVVDSPRFQITRTYDVAPAFQLSVSFYGYVGLDVYGLPVVIPGRELMTANVHNRDSVLARAEQRTAEMIADAQAQADTAAQSMNRDIQAVETNNAEMLVYNPRIADVLQENVASPNFGNDGDAWQGWWYEKVGYRYTPAPKVTITQQYQSVPGPSIQSCFAAGTPVRTIDGRKAIETLKVGDRVLSQDATTGQIGFEPVVNVHHNPPDKTVRVILDDGDEIVASLFHRFWIIGQGWVMARDLKTKDVVRTLGGRSKILKIEAGQVIPVFNLDVARNSTYFVGHHDALVHDNTLPDRHAPLFDVRQVPQPSDRR